MTDKELFDRTFLRMHASEDTLKEVYKMIEQKESRSHPGRIVSVLAVVAVVLALSTAAFATYRSWSPFLANLFGVSEAQQDALMRMGATSYVGRSAESEGVTMTVEQVIGDEFGCYVLIRLETDDPEIYGKKTSPRFEMYMDGDAGKQIAESWSWTDWMPDENSAAMYIGCWTGGKSGHTVTLTLTELMGSASQAPSVVWEGGANLSWDLAFNDATTTWYRAESVDGGAAGPAIAQICQTPVSVCVYFDAESVRSCISDEDSELRPVRVTLEDGSSCDLSMSAAHSAFLSDRNGAETYYMVQVRTEQVFSGKLKELAISTGKDRINYLLFSTP